MYGACRGGELSDLTVDAVEDLGSLFLIKLPDTKTHRPRSFVIESEDYKLVKKYISLRPKDAKTSRFFLNYQKGRCTQQNIDKNKIGKMPQKIARWLGLEEQESYTGHSFRRSSTTVLAESAESQVAQGYIEDSLISKRKRYHEIMKSINSKSEKRNSKFSESANVNASTSKDTDYNTGHRTNSPIKKIVNQTIYNINISSVGTFSIPDVQKNT